MTLAAISPPSLITNFFIFPPLFRRILINPVTSALKGGVFKKSSFSLSIRPFKNFIPIGVDPLPKGKGFLDVTG